MRDDILEFALGIKEQRQYGQPKFVGVYKPVFLPDIVDLCDGVIELSAEISELKERSRWRKQSEEPAPKKADLEIYIPPIRAAKTNRILSAPMLEIFRRDEWKVWPNEYWRPLDLPEEVA